MTHPRQVGRKGRNSVSQQDNSWVVELVKLGKKIRLALTVAESGDVLVAQGVSNGETPREAPEATPTSLGGSSSASPAVAFACKAK